MIKLEDVSEVISPQTDEVRAEDEGGQEGLLSDPHREDVAVPSDHLLGVGGGPQVELPQPPAAEVSEAVLEAVLSRPAVLIGLVLPLHYQWLDLLGEVGELGL